MFKPSAEILNNLKCVYCDRHLNTTPIMLKSNQEQICGKCFNKLPFKEREKCVRQIGYEEVAKILLFPCRYKLQGCEFEFPLNEAENHELKCPFRSDAPDLNEKHLDGKNRVLSFYKNNVYVTDENVLIHQDTDFNWMESSSKEYQVLDSNRNLVVNTKFFLTHNNTRFKYRVNVFGNDENKSSLCLQNSSTLCSNYTNDLKHNPVQLSIEGTISLPQLENLFCNVLINSIQEPFYDVIKNENAYQPQCSNCHFVIKTEIYHCPFGHDVCKICKDNKCTLCACPINSGPRYYCKNYSKGCHVYLLASDQYTHSRNCEFNDFNCLLEKCEDVSPTLPALKEHMEEQHASSLLLTNLVVRQCGKSDEFWTMLAYNNLFKCKRFTYENEVEFLVEFVGPHIKSKNFKYEIYVKSDNNKDIKLKRTSFCLELFSSALDRALIITKTELKASKIDEINFTYTLCIKKC